MEISMRYICTEENRFTRFQRNKIQEINTETSDIAWKLFKQLKQNFADFIGFFLILW